MANAQFQSHEEQVPAAVLEARRDSVGSTLGTHLMEGLVPDAETMDILSRYENGQLTLNEFSAAMDAHAETLIGTRQYLAGAA